MNKELAVVDENGLVIQEGWICGYVECHTDGNCICGALGHMAPCGHCTSHWALEGHQIEGYEDE